MRGYYTVRVTAQGLAQAERIVLESDFAARLERAAGGAEPMTALCLAAASEQPPGPAHAALRRARDAATSAMRAAAAVPERCHFSIQAWQARDL